MEVAVLIGGCSPEHEISLASAMQVLRHLDRRKWTVWPVFLDKQGGWRLPERPLELDEEWHATEAQRAPARRPGAALDWLLEEGGIDVVFPVLHGPCGEDGTVQGMLELHDVAFVGSGCAASAAAMDKLRTRQAFTAGGVPIAPAYVPSLRQRQSVAEAFGALSEAVDIPAFAKVDVSGSTVGVSRIENEADLASFLSSYGGRFRRWFAERAVHGEEITVPVLGNAGSDLQALPPVGIYPVEDDWFTHDAKYRPGATEEVVPPRGLTAAQIEEVQALAVRCHELLVCDGMSRTDMIYTEAGPVVLETNTIPGMTSNSLLPKAAAAAGVTFPALLDRLIELALERHWHARGASAPETEAAEPAASNAEA